MEKGDTILLSRVLVEGEKPAEILKVVGVTQTPSIFPLLGSEIIYNDDGEEWLVEVTGVVVKLIKKDTEQEGEEDPDCCKHGIIGGENFCEDCGIELYGMPVEGMCEGDCITENEDPRLGIIKIKCKSYDTCKQRKERITDEDPV